MHSRPLLITASILLALIITAIAVSRERGAVPATIDYVVALPAVEVQPPTADPAAPTIWPWVSPPQCRNVVPTPANGAQIATGDGGDGPNICVRLVVDGLPVQGIQPQVAVRQLHADRDVPFIQLYQNLNYGQLYLPSGGYQFGDLVFIDVAVPYLGRTYHAQATMTMLTTRTPWPTDTPTPTNTNTPTIPAR